LLEIIRLIEVNFWR